MFYLEQFRLRRAFPARFPTPNITKINMMNKIITRKEIQTMTLFFSVIGQSELAFKAIRTT